MLKVIYFLQFSGTLDEMTKEERLFLKEVCSDEGSDLLYLKKKLCGLIYCPDKENEGPASEVTAATALLLNETRDDLNELEGDFNNNIHEGQGTWVGKGGRKVPQLLDNLHYFYYIGLITS